MCRLIFGGAFTFCILLLFANPSLWQFLLGPLHMMGDKMYPFLDMHGRLAAFDAHRLGIDILHNSNPLDPMGRVNVKPTWPLGLSFLGLGRGQLIICGIVTIVCFISVILSFLKPTNISESLVFFLICFSPAVLLGIERANDDLVYFSLLALVPLSLKLKPNHRLWIAWVVIFILAPAKYYPGAVFLVLLGELKSWRLFGLLLGAGMLFIAAYVMFNIEELLYLRTSVPAPYYYMAHGGKLAFVFTGSPQLLFGFFFGAVASAALLPVLRKEWPMIKISNSERRWFLLGASVFGFCFLLNSNFDYRLIYILPMLPALIVLRREGGCFSRLAFWMIFPLPFIFWADIIILYLGIWSDLSLTKPLFMWVAVYKSLILWFFMIGVALLCGTMLRTNIRAILLELSSEFKRV